MVRYIDVDGSNTAEFLHQPDTVPLVEPDRLFVVDSGAGYVYRRANHYIGCAELDGVLPVGVISTRCA